ncbi:MAG: nucleotidyl transferase AbiEii/AbiGii toxin family protein [Bacillota bacterium]
MFENIMSAERHSVLEELVKQSLPQNFYLAGGTAAALYLGHRWSEDLDFFTEQEFDLFQLAGKLANIEGYSPDETGCFGTKGDKKRLCGFVFFGQGTSKF